MKHGIRNTEYGIRIFLVGFLLLIFGFLGPVARVQAVETVEQICAEAQAKLQRGEITEMPAVCKDAQANPSNNPIYDTLKTVINILSLLGGVVAVIVIMVGGIKMTVSGGDSNSVSSARQTVLYAVISLFIIASAQLVVRFIVGRLIQIN